MWRPANWRYTRSDIVKEHGFLVGDAKTIEASYLAEDVASAMLSALIKWLFEPCPHIDKDLGGDSMTMCYRHACGECMDELKEKAK